MLDCQRRMKIPHFVGRKIRWVDQCSLAVRLALPQPKASSGNASLEKVGGRSPEWTELVSCGTEIVLPGAAGAAVVRDKCQFAVVDTATSCGPLPVGTRAKILPAVLSTMAKVFSPLLTTTNVGGRVCAVAALGANIKQPRTQNTSFCAPMLRVLSRIDAALGDTEVLPSHQAFRIRG
jgi:hypothetical protein